MTLPIVIFDLDGTLADCQHRMHYISGDFDATEIDWERFYRACVDDKPIYPGIQVLQAMIDGDHDVQIWSGRSDLVVQETIAWTQKYIGHGYCENISLLRMRPNGDHRPDNQLKAQWLKEARASGFEPSMVFEDRKRVVDMWRANGVPCFQAADGDF